MSKFEFTRYLYIKDEVILSFAISLIQKENLHECYFWLSELYYSNYNMNDIILKIYYDFYYTNNAQFEKYIYKKLKNNDNNDNNDNLSQYITITKNLFNLSISCDVFLNRQASLKNHNKDSNKHIFKGRKPKWLDNIKQEFHILFRYLNKDKLSEFYCELYKMDDNLLKDIFEQFKIYDTRFCFRMLNNEFYKYDLRHMLLAYVVKDKNIKDTKKNKNIYVLSSDYENEQLINTNIPLPPRDFVDSRNITHKMNEVGKTLMCKRHFKINTNIICFDFLRRNMEHKDVYNKYHYNWEYYAYNCEVWKERMTAYKVSFDTKKNDEWNYIRFPNDDLLEEFYEKFGYEPDEQSKETNEKNLNDIHGHNYSINEWLKTTFDYSGGDYNILYY
jgi:hypothetical protein